MTFKNNLISRNKDDNYLSGQVVMEYLIIFIAIAFTVIAFISRIHNPSNNGVMDQHFDDMVNGILK